jgi:hypothetical protein
MSRKLKRANIFLFSIIIGLLIPVLIISFVIYSLENSKSKNNNGLKAINYTIPFILDGKAVLKAQYLNLTNYEPYLLAKCLASNLKNCSNPNIYITAYIYKNANPQFCQKIKEGIKINNYIIKGGANELRELCNLFYKLKTNNLTAKDCVGNYSSQFCSYYFDDNDYNFILSNVQLLNLINNPEKNYNCLALEKPAAYYCLKIKHIDCSKFEDPKEVEKCYNLLVVPNSSYSQFLNEVNNYLSNNNWNRIKELLYKTNNPELIHSLARLGVLNGSFCSNFLNKSLEQYRYCLKRYYNQRFMCQFSSDKRQCYFFDVLLNNKSCDLLKDPQERTDCELFKKYINKKDCNFFYTVGTNAYLGYLCAIYKKDCSGQWYYDKMYQIVCYHYVNQSSN